MTKISEQIISQIDNNKIVPAPRWLFAAKNFICWILFFVSFLLVAISFAVIADLLFSNDWDIYLYLHKDLTQYIFLSIPYLWVIFLLICIWFSFFYYIHTKGWYRHKTYIVIFASILTCMLFSSLFYFLETGRWAEKHFIETMPYYGAFRIDQGRIWCHAYSSLLGGEIKSIYPEKKQIELKDCMGNVWLVKNFDIYQSNASIGVGSMVKIIGKGAGDGEFETEKWRVW